MLLLFDFDGVVVNTLKVAYETSVDFGVEHPKSKEEYAEFFRGNVYEETSEQEQAHSYVSEDDPFFALYIPRMMRLKPIEGIQAVLSKLAAVRHLDIVSSGLSSMINTYLHRYELSNIFQHCYGADQHKKKSVKITRALAEHGVSAEETIFVTDTLGDIKEAAESGVRSIAVTWGYHDRATLAEGNPHAIVETPTELLHLLGDSH